ncbi:MAG: hypothetical protein ACPF8W_05695 [Luminiphilus sp.]
MVLTVTKPTVGGSEDSWGTTINTALDDIVLEINSNADGTNAITLQEGGFAVGATTVTVTGAEFNVLDGDTAAISTTVVDADRVVFNDAGTMKQVAMSDLKTYINASVGTGSVTSVAMTVPTGLSISGSPITTSGTLAVSLQSGYSIPTTSSQSNWDTAYGWGDHSTQGYAVGTIPTNNNQLTNGAGYITSVPTTVAAVGTYTFALSSVVPSPIPAGTVSGSQLTYSDGSGTNNVGTSPNVGTWRLMAHYVNRSSLFVRVS